MTKAERDEEKRQQKKRDAAYAVHLKETVALVDRIRETTSTMTLLELRYVAAVVDYVVGRRR